MDRGSAQSKSKEGGGWMDLVQQAMDKAKSIDEDYKVADRTKQAASDTLRTAKEIDKEHQVVSKTKRAFLAAVAKAKEIDEQHHIVDNTKRAAKSAVMTAKEIDDKHKITETTTRELNKMMEGLQTNHDLSEEDDLDTEGKINNTIESINYCNSRELCYKTELESTVAEAKTKMSAGDEKGALLSMKRKKMYEAEIDKVQNIRRTLEARLLHLMELAQSEGLHPKNPRGAHKHRQNSPLP